MDSKLTRRSFIAGTAVAGAACATIAPVAAQAQDGAAQVATADTKWSFEVAPDPIAEDQIAETKSADVIVVGCGMSGMVTAVSAAASQKYRSSRAAAQKAAITTKYIPIPGRRSFPSFLFIAPPPFFLSNR